MLAAYQQWGDVVLGDAKYRVTADTMDVVPPQPTWIYGNVKAEVIRDGNLQELTALDLQVTAPPGAPLRAIGERVRLRGYLRRPAGFANLPRRDPGPWRLRLKSARFLTLELFHLLGFKRIGPAGRYVVLTRRSHDRSPLT